MIVEIDKILEFEIEKNEDDEFEKDVSAITLIDDYALIGSDEGNHLQVLKKDSEQLIYKNPKRIFLDKNVEELDIEGITNNDSIVYVVCSCALTRKSVKKDKFSVNKNIERLNTVSKERDRSDRCKLFKFSFNSDSGTPSNIESISLKDILIDDPLLGRFMNIPSKENGVDIEGICVDENTLYIGFRGPVFRGNYVPIMVTTFDKAHEYKIHFVKMGGRGVRDITKVKDGFLIIGGPVGDGDSSYQLYFWDGSNSIEGNDKEISTTMHSLGTIPTKGAKAEGITVLNETETTYEVIVVFDSLDNGKPTLFKVGKDPEGNANS